MGNPGRPKLASWKYGPVDRWSSVNPRELAMMFEQGMDQGQVPAVPQRSRLISDAQYIQQVGCAAYAKQQRSKSA